MAKQSSTNKTLLGGVSGIIILLIALFAQFFLGIDVLNVEDEEGDTNDNQVVVEEPVSGEWYSIYFTSPLNTDDRSDHRGAPVEADVIAAIDGAQQSIDAAFYELNLASVVNALVRAQQRGVEVRLVVDDEAFVLEELTHPEDSGLDILQNAGFELYCEDDDIDDEPEPQPYDMRCDDRSALMHHKFMIIDGFEVWMGSMNMTHNGVYNNNNNFMRIRSSRLAQNYQYMFNLMFEEGEFNLRGVDSYDVPNRTISISGTEVETYFSPDDGDLLEQRIVQEVQNAQESVYVMVFNMSLDSVGDALRNRLQAGVDVRGVFENTGSLRGGQMAKIGCINNALVRQDGNPDVLHHKVIIIDARTVITGSFNYSQNARDNNSENTLIIDSPELAQVYINEFERLFNDSRADVPTTSGMGC